MKQPEIQLIPLREVVSRDSSTTLDVIIRIIPPERNEVGERLGLNLGLVIDRSGSMSGEKIHQARQAAAYAVEHLRPSDRVSVTIYDNKIDTIVPSTLAVNKHYIIQMINGIRPGGSTALHGGWVQGGIQVSEFFDAEQLNRVILLSDGLANVGETNPDVIATDVHGLFQHGVSTTTMGIGRDYNEDLMEAMARSGNGNYYYIESVKQLSNIFDIELQGLLATMGNHVTLKITTDNGTVLGEVLNDLEINNDGTYRLRDLMYDQPIDVVVRLKVPKMAETGRLCQIEVAWDEPKSQGRGSCQAELILPVVSDTELENYALSDEVRQQVALLMAAKAKEEATTLVDQGDYETATQLLQDVHDTVLGYSDLPMMVSEAKALDDLKQRLAQKDYVFYRKMAKAQTYTRHQGHDIYDLFYRYDRGPQLGDITRQSVDAIVNSVGVNFQLHGSVSAAIIKVAGHELLEECKLIGQCGFGEARITGGYNLPANWVIHTCIPGWVHDPTQAEQMLAQAYSSCLELAVAQKLNSIAFPALGTGLLNYPAPRAAEIAFKVTSQFLRKNYQIGTIKFICFDQKTLDAYEKAFHQVVGM